MRALRLRVPCEQAGWVFACRKNDWLFAGSFLELWVWCCAHLGLSPNLRFELWLAKKFPEWASWQVAPLRPKVDLRAMRVRGDTLLSLSHSSLNGCSLISHPGHCLNTGWSLFICVGISQFPYCSQGLTSSFVLTQRISVLKNGEESPWGAILDVAVWSLISGRTANFKQRVTWLVLFFFRQDWCGDLPLAEEKKVSCR